MRYEKIEVSTTRPAGAKLAGKVTVEAEAPQYESMDEFVQAAGGADKALEYVNGSVSTSAGNGGRATRPSPALHRAGDAKRSERCREPDVRGPGASWCACAWPATQRVSFGRFKRP